jgi:hypothetical protein
MRARGERGQVSAEYVGVLLLAAVIVAALIVSGVAGKITGGVTTAICRIAGGECGDLGGGGPTSPADRAAALERREQALAPFAAGGDDYAALLAQAAAARARGDYDEADRILDRLELYSGLADHDRGDLVDAVAGPSDDDFDDLVDQGTIEEDGGRNRRYFRVPPSPGDGLIVQDFFIPSDSSGGFLDGDGRDTVDPLLGDADLSDSRIVIVIDRETGRGVITQSHTCLAGPLPDYCEDARPIALRDPELSPQVDLPGHRAPNEFRVDAGDGSLEIEYDALNSITPGGLSVDGTVRFERGSDGYYHKVSDSRDPYPRIVTGQYRPGEPPRILDETDDEPVLPGALPGPIRDVIEGTGEVIDKACDIPPWVPIGGPFGPIGREIVC